MEGCEGEEQDFVKNAIFNGEPVTAAARGLYEWWKGFKIRRVPEFWSLWMDFVEKTKRREL